jgi:hypothetical protein
VNRYNNARSKEIARLEKVATQKEQAAKKDESEGKVADADLHRNEAKAARKAAQLIQRSKLEIWLPTSLALAFFAALCVALGHLVYQLAAPALIKEQIVDAFSQELGEGSKGAGVSMDALLRAYASLNDLAAKLPFSHHPNLVVRHSLTLWFPDNLEAIITDTPPQPPSGATFPVPPPPPAPPTIDRSLLDRCRVLIDEGTRAEYQLRSLNHLLWARIAFVLYVLAGSLLFWIIINQARSVMHSANWL